MFVSVCVTVTATPGTTAPDRSRAVPVIVPVSFCAQTTGCITQRQLNQRPTALEALVRMVALAAREVRCKLAGRLHARADKSRNGLGTSLSAVWRRHGI